MAVTGLTVDEAIRVYLGGLTDKQRAAQQAELARFARWFGSDVRLDSLKAEDIERYQEQIERSGASATRLEAVRTFLAAAHKQGLSEFNLGKFIKIKRAPARKDARAGRANGATANGTAADGAASSATTDDEATQMTREGYESLKKELDYLAHVKRAEIAHDLYEARIDKDIRENAPFDAAKQHQGEVEARIRYLERAIATAQIVDQRANGSRIGLGTSVVLRDLSHDEELTYTLVGTTEANPRAGRISIASPVGKALLDRQAGDEIEVEAPAGRIRYRVDKVEH